VEEVIWIEALSRHGEVVWRRRCTQSSVRIGRGYENDIVLDDPFVAPYHLTLSLDADRRLVAEDAGSINGLYLDRERTRRDRIVLQGDRPIRIGRTLIRVRYGHHPVAPERPFRNSQPWLPAAVLLVAIVGLELLSLWLREVAEPRLSRYAMSPLVVVLVAFTWAGFWALLCRVFTGEGRFARHLVIGLTGILVYSLYDEIVAFLAYGLSASAIAHYDYLGAWVIVALAVTRHLYEMGFGPRRIALGVAIGLVIVVGIHGLSRGDFSGREQPQQAREVLLPPGLRLIPPEGEAAFFADAERLRSELDRDRSKPPDANQSNWLVGSD
jgi:hypothetical protein